MVDILEKIPLESWVKKISGNMADPLIFARSFSTVSCGLLLGSTAWAGLAVMPSIIAAPISSHAKVAVFDGLIKRANTILPPIFLGTVASLGYLAYESVLPSTRTNYLLAAGSLLLATGLQIVIVPKNNEMQRKLRTDELSKEYSEEGNTLIGEVLYWNWGRVVLSAIALGAVLYAAEPALPTRSFRELGSSVGPDIAMAARKLEYGLE